MKRYILPLFFVLSACGHGAGLPGPSGTLSPLPGVIDPPDALADQAVRAYIAETGAPSCSLYRKARVDLNGDGRRDALALFKNPYGYWCDANGCTLLILEASDDGFTVLDAVRPVRGPIYIGANRYQGWKSIVVHVSGRWTRTKDVALRFDGGHYPDHPETLAEAAADPQTDLRLFAD